MPSTITTAAILAGGLATRLHPITVTTPKILVPVSGRPFVEHQLALLRRHGIQRVVFCLGHFADQVMNFVGDGSSYGLQVDYSLDGDTLLGTGGCLRKALPLLEEHFFCLYGDSYLDTEYQAIARTHLTSDMPATMSVFQNRNEGDLSNVWMDGGRLKVYSKKNRLPQMQHIDYGLCAIDAGEFLKTTRSGAFDLSDWFSDLSSDGKLGWHEVPRRFYEMGSPQGLKELEFFLLHKEII
ncbi:hypothetical protein BH11VER1_BH11VER1_00470 [soil metagenome]